MKRVDRSSIHGMWIENFDYMIKSLKIGFEPPPEIAIELAWLVTNLGNPVNYYRDGLSIVWQCDNMNSRYANFRVHTTLLKARILHKDVQLQGARLRSYLVTDVILIESS